MWYGLLLMVLVGVACVRSPAQPQTEEELATKVAGYAAQLATYDARPAATAPAGDPFCADAIRQVQQYKAPGQLVPVTTAVDRSLAAEQRPVQPQGWTLSTRAGESCIVAYEAIIGNARQRYTWTWTPATGTVAARDAATQHLSGW